LRSLPKLANFFTGVFRGRLAYICTIRTAQLGCFLIAGITAFMLRFGDRCRAAFCGTKLMTKKGKRGVKGRLNHHSHTNSGSS